MPIITNLPPGTVSQILWHFTGGPKWNDRSKRQSRTPKRHASAYEALVSILSSRELRLGNYAEVCRVFLPRHPRSDAGRRHQSGIIENVVVEVPSRPVCCIADIPVAHLAYHALRYGKFAIGFYREAVVEHGFNPVFYTLQEANVLQSLYWALYCLQLSAEELEVIGDSLGKFDSAFFNYLRAYCETSAAMVDASLPDDIGGVFKADFDQLATCFTSEGLSSEWKRLASRSVDHQCKTRGLLGTLIAFTKTFTREEFPTVYCEREWRSVKPFNFSYDQVAMIVLPKVIGKTKYYDEFLKSTGRKLRIPRRIPIVPWEELVEH